MAGDRTERPSLALPLSRRWHGQGAASGHGASWFQEVLRLLAVHHEQHRDQRKAGAATRLGLREYHAHKTALAALRELVIRVHAAASFRCHPDERIVEAMNELLAAVGDIKNTTRLEAALEAGKPS